MMPNVRSGADVYKPQPHYKLIMRLSYKPEREMIATSRNRAALLDLEKDLINCDYEFVKLEESFGDDHLRHRGGGA